LLDEVKWKLKWKTVGTEAYCDLGFHLPMHLVFAWAPQIPVFSYTRAQIHVSSLRKQAQSHTVNVKFKWVYKNYSFQSTLTLEKLEIWQSIIESVLHTSSANDLNVWKGTIHSGQSTASWNETSRLKWQGMY